MMKKGEEMRKNVKELKNNKTADKALDAVSYKVQELRIL